MEIKERIIKEATEIISTKGVKAMTMDGVAGALGISKRTLYEHFSDKDSLIQAIICRKGEKGNINIEEISKECTNVLELFFKIYEMGDESHLNLSIKLADEIKKYHPNIFEQTIKHSINEGIKFLKDLLERGIQEELFLADMEKELFANLIMVQTSSLLFSNNPLLKKFPLTEVYKASFFSSLRGISTLKGTKIIDKYLNR